MWQHMLGLHSTHHTLFWFFIIAGFGNGIEDAAWNAWAGNLANANEVLGFLHGFYGLGAVLSPLVATTLMTKSGWMWYEFYYIMVSCRNPNLPHCAKVIADWRCCYRACYFPGSLLEDVR